MKIYNLTVLVFISYIFAPRGVGIQVIGISLDLPKVLYIISLSLCAIQGRKKFLSIHDVPFLLFIPLSFVAVIAHKSPLNSLISLFYNIIFIYSAYYIGRCILESPVKVRLFVSWLLTGSLLVLPFYMLDWVNGSVITNSFRSYSSEIIEAYLNEGRSHGIIDLMGGVSFKSWEMNQSRASFWLTAILWLSVGIKLSSAASLRFFDLFALIFLVAALVLSQSRTGLLLLALLLFCCLLALLIKRKFIALGCILTVSFCFFHLSVVGREIILFSVDLLQQMASLPASSEDVRFEYLLKLIDYLTSQYAYLFFGFGNHIFLLENEFSFRRLVDMPTLLGIVMENGIIVGGYLLSIVFYTLIRATRVNARNPQVTVWLIITFTVLSMHLLTAFVFPLLTFMFFLLGGITSIIINNPSRKSNLRQC